MRAGVRVWRGLSSWRPLSAEGGWGRIPILPESISPRRPYFLTSRLSRDEIPGSTDFASLPFRIWLIPW